MASKTAVFFLLLAFWGILDIKAASVTSYKKDTWADRLADSDGSKRTANEDREESDYNAEAGDVAFDVDGVSDYYNNALENREVRCLDRFPQLCKSLRSKCLGLKSKLLRYEKKFCDRKCSRKCN
ncbi:hypothetical protein ABFA07_000634 [Porites harrisoni]